MNRFSSASWSGVETTQQRSVAGSPAPDGVGEGQGTGMGSGTGLFAGLFGGPSRPGMAGIGEEARTGLVTRSNTVDGWSPAGEDREARGCGQGRGRRRPDLVALLAWDGRSWGEGWEGAGSGMRSGAFDGWSPAGEDRGDPVQGWRRTRSGRIVAPLSLDSGGKRFGICLALVWLGGSLPVISTNKMGNKRVPVREKVESSGSTSPRCFFSVGARAASAEANRTADLFVSLS
jgi:hypothetical protein